MKRMAAVRGLFALTTMTLAAAAEDMPPIPTPKDGSCLSSLKDGAFPVAIRDAHLALDSNHMITAMFCAAFRSDQAIDSFAANVGVFDKDGVLIQWIEGGQDGVAAAPDGSPSGAPNFLETFNHGTFFDPKYADRITKPTTMIFVHADWTCKAAPPQPQVDSAICESDKRIKNFLVQAWVDDWGGAALPPAAPHRRKSRN